MRLLCFLNGHRWNPLDRRVCLRCHETNVAMAIVDALGPLVNSANKLLSSYESALFSVKPQPSLEVLSTPSPEMIQLMADVREQPWLIERLPPEWRKQVEMEMAEEMEEERG